MLNMREEFERFHIGKLAGLAALAILATGSFHPAQAQQAQEYETCS
jgi:hypothetical protein